MANLAGMPNAHIEPRDEVLTPRVLLTHPAWSYRGIAGDGSVTCWMFRPLEAPWVRSWNPDVTQLGPFQVTYGIERDGIELTVRTEVMARAVMELVPCPGPLHRSWSWDELHEIYRQARTAGYLQLREQGVPSADAQALAGLALDYCGAQRLIELDRRQYQVEPASVADAILRQARELGSACDEDPPWIWDELAYSQERFAAAVHRMRTAGQPPRDAYGNQYPAAGGAAECERGELFQRPAYIPGSAPSYRALPGIEAPAEHGQDSGTAAVCFGSDYDDPDKIFLLQRDPVGGVVHRGLARVIQGHVCARRLWQRIGVGVAAHGDGAVLLDQPECPGGRGRVLRRVAHSQVNRRAVVLGVGQNPGCLGTAEVHNDCVDDVRQHVRGEPGVDVGGGGRGRGHAAS
jgi:hypothetical protein